MAEVEVRSNDSYTEIPMLSLSPHQKTLKSKFTSSMVSSRTGADSMEPIKRLGSKTPSNLGTDEVKAFIVKPRYDSLSLRIHFKQRMMDLRDAPFELLEAQLYSASARNALDLGGKQIELGVVKAMHHIYELKQREAQLVPEEITLLNNDLERVLDTNPTALEEYKCISTLLRIASSLVIKWGLVNYDEYGYRLNGRAMHIRPLNLYTINSSLLSMETLWYSLIIEENPLGEFIDISTKQYAIVLREEARKILMFMLRMNAGDFWETPSIEGYLSCVNPELQMKYHMEPDYDQKLPEYQELRQPEGFLARFHKSPGQTKSVRLKKMLRDFELAFRAFEKSLISCFMRKVLRLDEVEDDDE